MKTEERIKALITILILAMSIVAIITRIRGVHGDKEICKYFEEITGVEIADICVKTSGEVERPILGQDAPDIIIIIDNDKYNELIRRFEDRGYKPIEHNIEGVDNWYILPRQGRLWLKTMDINIYSFVGVNGERVVRLYDPVCVKTKRK